MVKAYSKKIKFSEDAAAWSLPWTRWVQGGHDAYLLGVLLGVGIHSKYTERIRKFKYRQGNRRTGEHLRVILSIHILNAVANTHSQ